MILMKSFEYCHLASICTHDATFLVLILTKTLCITAAASATLLGTQWKWSERWRTTMISMLTKGVLTRATLC